MKKLLLIPIWAVLISCSIFSKNTKEPETKIVYKEKIVYRDTCDYGQWDKLEAEFKKETDNYHKAVMKQLQYNKDSMEAYFLHWRDSSLFVADSLARVKMDSIILAENTKIDLRWDSVNSDIIYLKNYKKEFTAYRENLIKQQTDSINNLAQSKEAYLQEYINTSNTFTVINDVILVGGDNKNFKTGFDVTTGKPYLMYGN